MKIIYLLSVLVTSVFCTKRDLVIRNPIISGWNPDPSIIRVGNEYFIATSSFEYWPGIPIYRSVDLVNWELYTHALTRPGQLQLYGVPTSAGAWAPSLGRINGKFYLTSMVRWTYDPVAKVWPRAFWIFSDDLRNWTDPIWSDPWGIDPQLYQDPATNKTYLNLMSPNNNIDRIWGIYQCEVDIDSGRCIGEYRSLWNGTMPPNAAARPEGPKMFKFGDWYYLLIAEGGTDELHRATIARSTSPEGPWESNPNNPLLYNGAYVYDNLTVQSTGHATLFETKQGDWYAVFLARRMVNGTSPLGRETFLCPAAWKDGWPILNEGKPILLDDPQKPGLSSIALAPFQDNFDKPALDPSWYQLRTPYGQTYILDHKDPSGGVVFDANVFSLSDRDVPAAILRKQRSLNMTFSADILPFDGILGPDQTVGISAYLSELQHQDIGLTGCKNSTGMCIYTSFLNNGTTKYDESPLQTSNFDNMTFHVRAEPLRYQLGYSVDKASVSWIASFPSSWMATAPPDWFVFEGAMFALFASGNGRPWPPNAPKVGFRNVREVCFDEHIPDHDVWSG